MIPPIYTRWQNLFQMSEQVQKHPKSGEDLFIGANERKIIKLNGPTLWKDLFIRGKAVVKPGDGSASELLEVRDIYILDGSLRIENIQLIARYRFQIPLYAFSRSLGQLMREHHLTECPFPRDEIVPSTPFYWQNALFTSDVEARDGQNLTTLMIASQLGDLEVVKLYIAAGANVRASAEGWTALKFATLLDNEALVDLLLEARADLEAVDEEGETPLHAAATHNSCKVAERLIRAKSNVSAEGNFSATPLENAAEYGAVEVLNLLVAAGARFSNWGAPERLSPALIHVITKGHLEVLQEAIQVQNFSVEATNAARQTPLLLAARYGHVKIVEYLLSMGAEKEAEDDQGTPLMWAAKNGHREAVKCLIDSGAKLNPENPNKSPLRYAAINGHVGIVRLLVEGGADLNRRDSENKNPITHAAIRAHASVVRFLLEKGADIGGTEEDPVTPYMHAVLSFADQVDMELQRKLKDPTKKDLISRQKREEFLIPPTEEMVNQYRDIIRVLYQAGSTRIPYVLDLKRMLRPKVKKTVSFDENVLAHSEEFSLMIPLRDNGDD